MDFLNHAPFAQFPRPVSNRLAKRERQRRWLARQRNGEAVCPVVVTERVLHALIALGWMQEAECDDRNEVGRAIAALLEDSLKI